MRAYPTFVLILLSLCVPSLLLADDAPKEDKGLEGEWELKTLVNNGKDLRKEFSKGTDKKMRLIFKDDSLTIKVDSIESTKKVLIDSGKTPKTLDFIAKDDEGNEHSTLAIYEVKGDGLRICFARPDKDRPKEFTGKEGTGYSLWTLQEIKK
jgi:uncharacterized protein (TIGR03067 family)